MSADGKQPQGSAESTKARAVDVRAKAAQEELLKKAQEKFASTDVGGDGKEGSNDNQHRKEALAFVRKECLNLPNDRFNALVDAIAEILKRKGVEKTNLENEFKKAREEVAKDVSTGGKTESPATQETKKDVGMWRSAGNALMDKMGYDREILRDNFEPGKTSVHNSANYLEYAHQKGLNEFLLDVQKSADRIYGFCKHWNSEHPVYKELVRRGEASKAEYFESMRKIIESKYSLGTILKKKDPSAQEVSAEKSRIAEMVSLIQKAEDFHKIKEKAAPTALDRHSDESVSARFLKGLASGLHAGDAAAFAHRLKTDPKMAMTLVTEWNPKNPVYATLTKENSAESRKALEYVKNLKTETEKRVGLAAPTNSKEREAYENILKQDAENTKRWEAIETKSREIEMFLREKKESFAQLAKSGNNDRILKEQDELKAYIEKTINPLIGQAGILLGQVRPGTPDYETRQEAYRRLEGRRLAAQYLQTEDFDQGFFKTTSDRITSGLTSGQNRLDERKAREDAFLKNLDGKLTFTTYSSERKNHAANFQDFERKVTTLDSKGQTLKELNSNDLAGYVVTSYRIGRLNSTYLVKVLPNTALQNALHYGIKNGKIDRNFQSEAMKKLLNGTDEEQAAGTAFQKALLELVNQQVSKEKIEKVGYPALKEYMEKHGNGHKFESVRKSLDSAKDGMDRLQALMEAMGASSSDPKAVEKFLNADLPAISKTIEDDYKKRADMYQNACLTKYPAGTTLRELDLTPLRLRLAGKDKEFLMEIFTKKLETISYAEAKRLQTLVEKAHANAEKNKLPKEDRDHLQAQLTPLGSLIKAKEATLSSDQIAAVREAPKAQQAVIADALTNPQDQEKRKKAESVIAEGAAAKQNERVAQSAVNEHKRDSERWSQFDDIAKRLGYDDANSIMESDTKVVRAWNEIANNEERYRDMPGFREFRETLLSKFESILRRKEYDGTLGKFYTEAVKKETPSREEEKANVQKISEETSARNAAKGGYENAETRHWAKNFFDEATSIKTEGSDFMENVPVGERIRISEGYLVERTATGVAFVTPDGKWKVDGKAAQGAVSIAKTLHESGADFLIASIGRLAAAEGIGYQDGSITPSDERKLLTFMADFFGIKSFDRNEPDAETMRKKFTRALASEGRSLKQKGKDIGIVSDSGSLLHTKLDERLATFGAYRARSAQPAKAEPRETVGV